MVVKLKYMFFPTDYMISLYRKLQNLRQKEMYVKEFIEEFYRLSIHSRHTDEGEEAVVIYVNGLKYTIWDELIMLRFEIFMQVY